MSIQDQQSALPFFWDLFKRQARDAPAKIANTGKMIGAGTVGLLGDVQNAVPGSPRYAPTTQAVAEKINADPSGYGGLLGQVIAPGPGEFKGLLGGAKALAKGLASQPGGFGGLLGMTLFHGTPHKFDMFELSPRTIGTGEGAQAYGHGLYFAENPGVARSYRQKLGDDTFLFDGKEIGDSLSGVRKDASIGAIEDVALDAYMFSDGNMDEAIKTLSERAANSRAVGQSKYADDAEKSAAWLKKNSDRIDRGVSGHLYEVDIPDETIDKMLDWDAPLSEQPDEIKRAAHEMLAINAGATPDHPNFKDMVDTISRQNLDMTGADFYRRIAAQPHMIPGFKVGQDSQEAASAMLRERGIPGIRFYDGASRSAKDGTRNIVVFDPNDIRQVKRDGTLVYKR